MSRSTSAQTSSVPAALQAELLAKLGSYDRNFAARAGGTARVLLVMKSGSAESELSVREMKSALGRVEHIGGLAHQETIVPYIGAAALAQRARAEHVAVIFIAAGLDDEIESIRAALSDVDVLSVGALAKYVLKGIVLGFELESGRPRIVIHLGQAKRQRVDFSSNVLGLMRVIR